MAELQLAPIDPTIVTQYVRVSKAAMRAQLEAIAANFDAIVAGWPTGSPTGGGGGSTSEGTTWFNGSGDPPVSLGDTDDYYLDTSNGAVWVKTGGVWVASTNITGPAGPPGTPDPDTVLSVNSHVGPDVTLDLEDVGGKLIDFVLPDTNTVSGIDGLNAGDGMGATAQSGNRIVLSTDPITVKEDGTPKTARLVSLNFVGATVNDAAGVATVTFTPGTGGAVVRPEGSTGTFQPAFMEFSTAFSVTNSGSTSVIDLTAAVSTAVGTIIQAAVSGDLGGAGTFVRPGFYSWNGTAWVYLPDLMYDVRRQDFATFAFTQAHFRKWFYFYDGQGGVDTLQDVTMDLAALDGTSATNQGVYPNGNAMEEIYCIVKNTAGLRLTVSNGKIRVPGSSIFGTSNTLTIATSATVVSKMFTLRFNLLTNSFVWVIGQI